MFISFVEPRLIPCTTADHRHHHQGGPTKKKKKKKKKKNLTKHCFGRCNIGPNVAATTKEGSLLEFHRVDTVEKVYEVFEQLDVDASTSIGKRRNR